MNILINPSKALGSVYAPPSKSLTHRYIISAALADGISHISNVQFSEDIKASIDCARALGCEIDVFEDSLTVRGTLKRPDKPIEFMCKESGSTIRFFMGIAMSLGTPAKFYGSSTLLSRPFGIYEKLAYLNGIEFERHEDYIYLNGKLSGGEFTVPGDISSQFITGLLFALPMLEKDSVIKLLPPVESRSYINLTLQALKAYGVKAEWTDETTLFVKGNQQYKPFDISVEGDYSNAAFLEALNVLGGKVEVLGLNSESLQGDKVYIEHLKALKEGAPVIDLTDCPDLGPVLMAIAASQNGAEFVGTRRLKIKESNRGEVMCEELSKFGVKSSFEENRIVIEKGALCKPNVKLLGHNDHRIVMSMTLLATITGGEIEGAQAVKKSYPEFFEVIKKLGIEVEYAVD